jgi:hypothetical protein
MLSHKAKFADFTRISVTEDGQFRATVATWLAAFAAVLAFQKIRAALRAGTGPLEMGAGNEVSAWEEASSHLIGVIQETMKAPRVASVPSINE